MQENSSVSSGWSKDEEFTLASTALQAHNSIASTLVAAIAHRREATVCGVTCVTEPQLDV